MLASAAGWQGGPTGKGQLTIPLKGEGAGKRWPVARSGGPIFSREGGGWSVMGPRGVTVMGENEGNGPEWAVGGTAWQEWGAILGWYGGREGGSGRGEDEVRG